MKTGIFALAIGFAFFRIAGATSAGSLEEAQGLYARNAYHEAIKLIKSSLGEADLADGDRFQLQLLLGNCHAQAGVPDTASALYKTVIGNHPKDRRLTAIAYLNLACLKSVAQMNADPTELVTRFYFSKETAADTATANLEARALQILAAAPMPDTRVTGLLLSFTIPIVDVNVLMQQLLNLLQSNANTEWRYFTFLNLANLHVCTLRGFSLSSPDESAALSADDAYHSALEFARSTFGENSRQVAAVYVNRGSYHHFAHLVFWEVANSTLYRDEIPQSTKDRLMLIADQAAISALSDYQSAIVTSLRDFKDTVFYRIPIVYSLNATTIQDNVVSFNEFRTAYLLKVDLYNALTFHYYHDDWNWDTNVDDYRIRSSGLMSLEDGFDYTISGYAYNAFSYYDKFIEVYAESLKLPDDKLRFVQGTYKDRVMAVDAALNYQDNLSGFMKGVGKSGSRNRSVITVKDFVQRSAVIDAFNFAEKTKALLLLKEINTPHASVEGEMEMLVPPIPHISELESKLDPSTAVISYLISPYNFYIFVITHDGLNVYYRGKLNSAEVNRRIRSLRNAVLFKVDDVYAENAWELGKIFLPRLDDEISKLIIIPDGFLNTLPFELLFDSKVKKGDIGDATAYPFWIRKYEISYAFSATLFQDNLSHTMNSSPSFLGYAPVFSDEDNALEVDESSRSTLTAFDALDSAHARSMLNGRYITPIPNTEEEVDYLQDLFRENGLTARVVTHAEATEHQFKTESFSNFNMIHLATHGFVNPREPELSGILFMEDTTSKDDGILYSREILHLNLNADLITLSACETGLGQVIVGEGVLGLTRSLTLSGARNLLVSYWKVSDASTSELMRTFYREVIENKRDLSAALRMAKLKLINSGTYAQPYFWSPFVLIRT